jgi:hypothetical protein
VLYILCWWEKIKKKAAGADGFVQLVFVFMWQKWTSGPGRKLCSWGSIASLKSIPEKGDESGFNKLLWNN